MLQIGIPRETRQGETRVAGAPDCVKKLVKQGLRICVEKGAGEKAGFTDEEYVSAGGQIADTSAVYGSDIVLKVGRPTPTEIGGMKKGSLLICLMDPFVAPEGIARLAEAGIDSIAMEFIPRISRAQSMDALSSQAGIAGYRAVIEAAAHYGRFFPLMMTSAGSSKPAKVAILGAGVAGLQAISAARRLGASVESYDVRPEVKEQILSLGAKFIELDVGESGAGSGGYAKELSEEGRKKQQQLLTEKLKKFDIIVSTANIPGKKAPVLITEEAVKGMRSGSVIVDMAAANGGNCPLSEADKVVVKHGVTLIGTVNFPALMPADASLFYGNNLVSLLSLLVEKKETGLALNINLDDEIIKGSLVTHKGSLVRK